MLTALTGCDNVAWGGVEWELRAPPAPAPDSAEIAATAPAPPPVLGPVLLAGERDGERATLAVVGELRSDSIVGPPDAAAAPELARQLAARTAPGSEWILFSEGVRVGTLRVDETRTSEEYCPARPVLSGFVELVPGAVEVQRLLALPADVAEGRAYEAFEPVEHRFDQRVANLDFAGDALPRYGATYPAGGLVEARQDVQAFQLRDVPTPTIAATYVYRDRLEVAPPGQGAYALFVMATGSGEQFRETFTWYRSVDTEGKGAPRYFGHLDWDGDGDGEILLEVFGANRRWFAGLTRRQGQWVRTFQDSCAGPRAGG